MCNMKKHRTMNLNKTNMRIFNKMKKTMLVLAASLFCANVAFADTKTVYSWESPDGTVVETGGTIAYTNGNGERLNYANADYYTICLNGKSGNINDATASDNAGHMLLTLDEALQTGDVINITAYRNKTADGKAATIYFLFENGAIWKDANVFVNIAANDADDDYDDDGATPNTVTWTITEAEAGSKTIKLTRNSASTNLFITKLDITREEAAGGDETTGYDLTAYNEAVAAAEAYKATLNPEDEMDAMLIMSVDDFLGSAASWLEEVQADPEATQADVDFIAEDLTNNIALLKVQAEIEALRAEGQEVLALYPEETRTDNAGLVLALRNLPMMTMGYTMEQLIELRDAVKTAIPAFQLENNQLILDTAAKKATDYAAILDASEETGTAAQMEAYNTLTYYASEEVLAQIDATSYDAVMEYSQTIDAMIAQYDPAIQKEKTIMAATTAVAEAQATLAAGGTDEAGLADAIAKVNTILGEINMWDTEYTLADLTAAVEAMEAAEEAFVNENKPVETLVEITSEWIVNPTVNSSQDGWTSNTNAQNKALATNKVATSNGNFEGKFLENWLGSAITGEIYQEIADLPAGAYKFQISAFAELQSAGTAGVAYVFANESTVEVNTLEAAVYSVDVTLAEQGTLKIGMRISGGANWVGIDNAKLFQTTTTTLGAEQNALAEVVDSVAKLKASYAAPVEVEALDAAVAAIDNSTIESCKASVEALNEAMAAFKKVNDAEVAWQALAATLSGATADAPVDATGFIANPSFEDGESLLQKGTGGGDINQPNEWKLVVKQEGWGDMRMNETAPQDGKYMFNVWSGTVHSVDLNQAVRLPGGSYTVTAAMRTEWTHQVTNQHLYAVIGTDTIHSDTLKVASIMRPTGDDATNANEWKTVDGWQTLTAKLTLAEETVVTIGVLSTGGTNDNAGWFQLDNFRLSCTGWADPALAPAVDSLNALVVETEAYQKTLDLTDAMQASMSESLVQSITAAKAAAEAKESVAAVREAYNQLNMMYVQIVANIASMEAQAAQTMMGEYENPTDEAGLANAITKVMEIVSNMMSNPENTYTVADLNAAVEAMRTAKDAFVKENTKITEPVVKMTYVDYDQPSTAMGEIAAGASARAGYNKISDGSVAFANTGWGENKITYIQVDASCYTGDIVSAKLTVEVSGSTDSKRTTGWGIGYNSSVWSADMTYETADKTITTMGEQQWTSTKSATTFETKTFDILDAFKGDADKVVTLVVYETAAAGGYIKNPVVAIEAANADEITTYTVTYVDEAGAEIAEPFIANIMIGEKAALSAEDKADKYNADKTKKYIYASCDKESLVAVADSASNVITATFREAAKYNYTVETVDDSGSLMITMGSYSGFEGDEVKAPYYAYVLNEADSTLYESAKNGKEYNQYITLTQDNMKVQVNYTQTTIKNVVYYQEAENVEGLTLATNANTGIRSSNSASAYAADADVVLTNLAAGKYTLTAVICDTKSALGAEFSFIAGADTVLKAKSTAVNWSSSTSNEFTLTANTTISLAKGGNDMQGVDFFYIQKTGDVELPTKIAYLNKEGDTDDAIYDALVAAGYTVDALPYADSTLTAEMIEANLAGYNLVVLGGSTGSGTNLAKTANLLVGKVNVLSTKSFWYKHYGVNGDNPGSADAPSISMAKTVAAHPIYNGIEGDEFAVFNDMAKANGRYLQSNGTFNDWTQKTLGTTLGADCIGETWVDGKGYVIVPVDGLQPSGYLTADGAQLFANIAAYLIAGKEYVAPVVDVTGITLDQAVATVEAGATVTLVATVTPEDATDKTVVWTSSDEAIATVADGVVTGVAAGEVTITAQAGEFTATCTITVTEADGINGIYVDGWAAPANIYDVNGRMIKQGATSLEGLQKGLYIINGKKVLVK